MNTSLIIAGVVLFIILDIVVLKFILNRRRAKAAAETNLSEFAAAQGWEYHDRGNIIGYGPEVDLTADGWSLHVKYTRKGQSQASLTWTAPVAAAAPFALTPALPPQFQQIMAAAPADGPRGKMVEAMMDKMLQGVGSLPSGLALQKDADDVPDVTLFHPDAAPEPARTIYNSAVLSDAKAKLPKDAGLTITHDGTILTLAIVVNTSSPDVLVNLAEAGQSVRAQLS